MAIYGKGIDIVSISRMARVCSNRALLGRIFTAEELRLSSSVVALARRFALKEAFVKALGTGFSAGIGSQKGALQQLPQ